MSKFKVGDKVKAAASTKWWRKGDAGLVRKIDDGFWSALEGGFKVAFEGGETWWFCDDEESSFELVDATLFTKHEEARLADALRKDMLLGISGDSVTIYPNPPHKHQIEIIAWANGAVIEVSSGGRVFSETSKPEWIDTLEYRIKSTKTPLQIEIEELEVKLVKLKGQL